MKLATLKNHTRDGQLVVISRDLQFAVDASPLAATMQLAIEHWRYIEADLNLLYQNLNNGIAEGAFNFDPANAMAPMPRAYQWLDGSAFTSHGKLMEKAFNLPPIEGSEHTPLMYQGAGDDFLGGRDDVPLPSEAHGIDFEGELAVMVDDIPMGCGAEEALKHIRLILQLNDVSLRALAPREMKTGFGFLQAKPSSSFAPVAVTPDELGEAWVEGRIHLPVHIDWNGKWFGNPHAGQMTFGFGDLIAHAALTRTLRAGTIVGSGTISNADGNVGSACIAERRALELLEFGEPRTPFMRFGDHVRMDVIDGCGKSVFGGIDQRIVQATR